MKKPKISIVITYFKKRKYILETIKSIYNQSYQNFELIFIFDQENRTDVGFIRSMLKRFKKKKLIINKKNLGVARSRNIGIKNSQGFYIAFIDADDVWYKNKLLNQVNFMEKNNADFSYTSYDIIDKDKNFIKKRVISKNISYKKLIKHCEIGLSTVILKSEIMKKNKFPNLKTQEDFGLWLCLLRQKYNFKSIPSSLSMWRKLDSSLSSNKLQKVFDAFKLFYFYEKLSFFKSIFGVIILIINKLKKFKI